MTPKDFTTARPPNGQMGVLNCNGRFANCIGTYSYGTWEVHHPISPALVYYIDHEDVASWAPIYAPPELNQPEFELAPEPEPFEKEECYCITMIWHDRPYPADPETLGDPDECYLVDFDNEPIRKIDPIPLHDPRIIESSWWTGPVMNNRVDVKRQVFTREDPTQPAPTYHPQSERTEEPPHRA